MIFLSQFLNLEMSSILIMIVEGFFKLLELRRGKRGRRKERKEVEICVCLALEKKGGYDFSPWVRLNKDDTNGFNSLNYYVLPSNTITPIWLSSLS